MKRRIATERLPKVYIARCGYTWLDESKWPKSGQLAQLPYLFEDSKRKDIQLNMVIRLIGHSWGHLDSSNHVYPHLAI